MTPQICRRPARCVQPRICAKHPIVGDDGLRTFGQRFESQKTIPSPVRPFRGLLGEGIVIANRFIPPLVAVLHRAARTPDAFPQCTLRSVLRRGT